MSAEHKRPLVAFLLVALVCAFTVGQSVRDAALRQLVNAGLPLIALVPIAPDVLLTINATGANGRYLDTPYLGLAIRDAARVPGPAVTPPTTEPSSTSVVVQVVATSAPSGPSHPATGHHPPSRPPVHHPKPPKPPKGQTTTLAAARADLEEARAVARQAALTAKRATAVATACVAKNGSDACQPELLDAQEADIRSSDAAVQVAWNQAVIGRLLEVIAARIYEIRAKAGRVFTARVEAAKATYTTARTAAQSELQAYYDSLDPEYAAALATYSDALAVARQALNAASVQRLREIGAHNQQRTKQVQQVNRTYAAMVKAGHVAAAKSYRAKAYAALAKADRVFNKKIAVERSRATAAFDAAAGTAKSALSTTLAGLKQAKADRAAEAGEVLDAARAALSTQVQAAAAVRTDTVAQARAEAEASVVIDPSTVPVPTGG